MSERIYEQIGRRIREIRKSRELTLEALAVRAGLTASYLGQVERVERKLSLLTVGKIAAALDVSPTSFYHADGDGRSGRPVSAWARRVLRVLESLSASRRDLVWDTMQFVIKRDQRKR
jgi:transcriptional regulator with XRE-family HTH domain